MQPANMLQRGALISVEFLVIAGALYVGVLGFHALAPILLPLLFALLLTALLAPAVLWLGRHRVPHAAAVILVIAAFLVFVIGGLSWIVPTILDQAGRAASQAQDGLARLPDLLKDLGIRSSDTVIHDATERAKENLGNIGASISSSAFSVAAASVSVLFGAFLTFVLLTYFLWDGEGFWHGAVRMLAPSRRERVLLGGRRTAHALITFVRSQVVVAAFDAVGIAIGLLILGVPLVLPLAVLTFVLSFIPYVGATLSGLLIALVALSTQGAGAMVGIILIALLVQFVEGHVVYPLLIGRNLKLHPITVLLSVGLGSAALGILGAFFATPLLAGVAAAAGLLPDQIDEAELAATQQEVDAMHEADAAEQAEAEAEPPPADARLADE
ncbi:MAG: AI-2E family transporter [Solirubrobacteraceae bacterium]|nr:AI-2E family transporter [Solirubrobacteraceae bacterium]